MRFLTPTILTQQATPTNITEETPSQDKLDDLTLIEKRLENWFVKQSQSSVQFTGDVKRRFDSLRVDRAHQEFGQLGIMKSSEGVITGIKCKNRIGNTKFLITSENCKLLAIKLLSAFL